MICYIGVGSNLGNRFGFIRRAVVLLEKDPGVRVKKISDIYETEPMGGPGGQGKYLNLVIKVESALEPLKLLFLLKKIEKKCGRKIRKAKWAAREIDLDILLYGDKLLNFDILIVPHPFMHKRIFVLKPLLDIAPRLKHPVFKKTIKTLFDSIKDKGIFK